MEQHRLQTATEAYPWPATEPVVGLSPAQFFNGYVGANVVFALERMSALSHLAEGASTVERLALATGVDADRLDAVLAAASRLGLVARHDGQLSLTETGRELARNAGYFVWAVGGYAAVLGGIADWARGEKRYGHDLHRDPVMVALGSAKCDASFIAPVFFEVLDGLDFTCVADLGCGTAARLIEICKRYPVRSGLGVEISEGACQVAREAVARAGLQHRIEVHCADATRFDGARDRRESVDLVASFLLMHDLFAAVDPPEALFDRLRETFPNARRFLLADTNRMPAAPGAAPIFSVGFELVHSVMGVRIRPREEYERTFRHAGLRLRERRPLGVPNTWLYLLEAEA